MEEGASNKCCHDFSAHVAILFGEKSKDVVNGLAIHKKKR